MSVASVFSMFGVRAIFTSRDKAGSLEKLCRKAGSGVDADVCRSDRIRPSRKLRAKRALLILVPDLCLCMRRFDL